RNSFSNFLKEVPVTLIFTFSSTAILEFLLLNIPFVQIVPKSRSEFDPGFFVQFPLARNHDALKREIEKASVMYHSDFNMSFYLADLSEEFDSIGATVSTLLLILNESN